MEMHRIISLLTDFGWTDGHVGAMKGAILSINPLCHIVDVAHEIPPHDVIAAAFILGQTYHYFPPGTIHVVVVDPGVGGTRKAMALETEHFFFVAPDNGVLELVLRKEKILGAYELTEAKYFLPVVSQTFHGRDIFGPVAAHLSQGVPAREMGSVLNQDELVRLDIPEPSVDADTLQAQVIHVDRFGNLVTNVSRDMLKMFSPSEHVTIEIGDEELEGFRRSYSEGQQDEIIAVWGSGDFLELSLREKSLSRERGWARGEPVRIRRGA